MLDQAWDLVRSDSIATISLALSLVALTISALLWRESRFQNKLRHETTLPEIRVRPLQLINERAFDFAARRRADSSKWNVVSVRAGGWWRFRKCLAKVDEPTARDAFNQVTAVSRGQWARRRTYDPPITSDVLIVRGDIPDRHTYHFTVCLESAPQSRRTVMRRIQVDKQPL